MIYTTMRNTVKQRKKVETIITQKQIKKHEAYCSNGRSFKEKNNEFEGSINN